jgi:predicted RNase H-like nuclease
MAGFPPLTLICKLIAIYSQLRPKINKVKAVINKYLITHTDLPLVNRNPIIVKNENGQQLPKTVSGKQLGVPGASYTPPNRGLD